MNNRIKMIGATALAGLVALGAATPSFAAGQWPYHHPQHNYYNHYHQYHHYSGHPYYNNYGYRPYNYDPGLGLTAGFIGGVFGAIAGSALSGGGSHVARCEATYRSYVPATNTYTGYDGLKHACTL